MYEEGSVSVWAIGTRQMHKYGKYTRMIVVSRQQFMERGADAD